MNAITVRQPWADLIARGIKQFETRSWKTEHRGWIAIHAGKAELPRNFGDLKDLVAVDYPEKDFGDLGEIKGAVVAVANLVGMEPLDDPFEFSSLEVELGEFGIGRHGWKLEDVRELEVPIFCSGKQGLWKLPNLIVDYIGDSNLGYLEDVRMCYSYK